MKFVQVLVTLIYLNVALSMEFLMNAGNNTQTPNLDCEMNVVRRIQQIIIQYSAQNASLIQSILQMNSLEQNMHNFLATVIRTIDEQLSAQNSP
ncbi:unnamed protein product [Schistosoma turkestanicum]|nr:unnamed protein product [Schistosoma turkestanicum]